MFNIPSNADSEAPTYKEKQQKIIWSELCMNPLKDKLSNVAPKSSQLLFNAQIS